VVGDTGIWGDVLSGIAGAGVQALVVVGGGFWAFHLYRKRREFRPKVRVDASARIAKTEDGEARVFLRLHISNESAAYIRVIANVLLWEVTTAPNNYPRFREIGRDFPMDYVYGDLQPNGVFAGPDGYPWDDSRMEPKECIDSEMMFRPDPMPKLMAVRTNIVEQKFKRLMPFFWIKDPIVGDEWDTFAYLDPACLSGIEYVPIVAHGAN
jgi:hypothetical protein